MASTTISIARVLQLGVPIAWQEAVEVARAAEAAAERHSRRLTVEGCIISTAGTVEVGSNGTDRLGAGLTALQLLAILIEGQQAPAELRALAATADDALSSFPSESPSAADQPLSLEWFVRPNPEVEIASLATRALEAAAPPVEPQPSASKLRPHPLGGDRSAPMTFERPADRRTTPPPIEEAVRPVPPPVLERHGEPPRPVAEFRVEPPKPAVAQRPVERRPPQAPVVEAARPVQVPAVPERLAEPPRPAARARGAADASGARASRGAPPAVPCRGSRASRSDAAGARTSCGTAQASRRGTLR